ncbi:MAG TPA: histidine--tRNA ligase [Patescibacteria group bacterium]|nr:histidine--tRNA ligase [Patescibacteria group bacterium]
MPKQRSQNNRSNKKNINTKPGKTFSRALGTKDVTVKDFDNWEIVKKNIVDFLHRYGFKQIETPIFEKAELFKSSFRSSDPKETYSFLSDKKEKLVLRPELTQGILRAYQEYNLEEEMLHPVRLFSVGPVFRQEKLQNGRYRQFNQVNAEVLGEDKPVSEVLLMVTAYNMFKDLGLDVEVQINSLGDKECQKEYKVKLLAFYKERGKRSKLCNSCKKLLDKDPLALLDCKEKECMDIRKDAPQIADFLSEDSREHFGKVVEYLDELEIRYNFDPYLVRGLSYYNDTVFEIWPLDEKENAQFKYSLGGGGRYDNLVEKLGNKATPAVGMAIGLERTLTKIKEQGLILFPKPYNLIFIAQISEQAKIRSLQIFEELRKEGYNVRHSFATNSLKTQLQESKDLDARLSLILGKKELNDDTILLRDMESGVQEIIPQKKIKSDINKKLK